MKDINQQVERIHQLNIKWWQDLETGEPINRNKGELIALMHSEVSEAFDGMISGGMDDHLPDRLMEEVEMADVVIRLFDYCGGFGYDLQQGYYNANEHDDYPHYLSGCGKTGVLCSIHKILSDMLELERKSKPGVALEAGKLLSVIESYCSHFGLNLEAAIEEKLVYNANRADHKHENRKAENGKKF